VLARQKERCGSSSLNRQQKQKWKRNVGSNICSCCCCWLCQVFGKVSGRQATSNDNEGEKEEERERGRGRRRNCNLLWLIWEIPEIRPCHIRVLPATLSLPQPPPANVSVSQHVSVSIAVCSQPDNLSQRVSSCSRSTSTSTSTSIWCGFVMGRATSSCSDKQRHATSAPWTKHKK